jgi:hypothetical protein
MGSREEIALLKQHLSDFERLIIENVASELVRIGRVVKMRELKSNPFSADIANYINCMYLDEENCPLFKVSSGNMAEKYLPELIRDVAINHWGIIELLGLLQHIPCEIDEVKVEVKPPVPEFIGHEGNDTFAWVCICGNKTNTDGFYTCDRQGNDIVPTTGSIWGEFYRCGGCGRIIDKRSRRVLGKA